MNKKTLVTIIFFLQIMICWNLNAAPVRQQINLNRGWLFTLGDVEGAEQTSFSSLIFSALLHVEERIQWVWLVPEDD